MPHDAGNASGSDGAAIGASPKPIAFFAVGKIETADGPFTIVRSDSAGFPGRVGDVVFRGDIVETAIGTEALIVFVDGTTFRLYSGTQLVLDQFTHGPDPSSNATALRVGKGKFGFIAGTVARTGRFVVNTPLSTIRSVAPAGGMGAAAFLFVLCVIRQVEAQIDVPSFSEELSFADPEDLTPNDLWHGVYDVLIEGVVHSVHDPEEALVARHRGAGVVVERVKHSSQQMSDLQLEFGKAAAYFKLAQLDPFVLRAGNERAGSSTFASTFDLQQLAGLSKPYFPVVYSPPPAPVQLQIPMGGQVGSGSHVTYAAHFELLPISNDQQPGTIIFLGPRILPRDQGVPPNSVAIVSLSIPQGETLLSVQIYDLPVGDTIICNGISYAGGGPGSKITISAGNFYATGLYLEGHASATTDIYLTATVLGLGGALESPKDAGALTLSVDLSGAVTWTGEANPPDQDWNNPDNWSTKAVPIPFQDVRLHSLGSSYVINVTDADVAIDSLVVEAGVTLNIKNGRTFSLTTESIKPLANAGIVTVDSALLIIGIPAPALEGIVTNAGTLQIVNDGTVEFINVAVANGGTISMATATSTLELNATTIDGGTIINHGLLKASVGTSVLSNLASGHFSNDGTKIGRAHV